jgi:hypothetical protein
MPDFKMIAAFLYSQAFCVDYIINLIPTFYAATREYGSAEPPDSGRKRIS